MYNETYEEYIRSILGYPQRSEQSQYNMYSSNDMRNTNTMQMEYMQVNTNMSNTELESCYPEIYRVIYPMVRTACQNNNNRVPTRELVDNLTDEIYFNIEENNDLSRDSNSEVKESTALNRSNNQVSSKIQEIKKQEKQTENRSEDRRLRVIRNRTLHDLIRILILRELLGRPGNNNRPPRPPFPGRPPFLRRPNRPPMRPRMFEDEYNLYE